MHTYKRWGVAAVGGLLIATLSAGLAAAGVAQEARHESDGSSAAPRADPPGTRYIYRGTFTADISHDLDVDWGGADQDTMNLIGSVSGTIPSIMLNEAEIMANLDASGGFTKVTDVSGTGITRTNSGKHVQTCKASSGSVPGPPILFTDSLSRITLAPYPLLVVPASCTDESGVASTATYEFGSLFAPLKGDSEIGAQTMTYTFYDERGTAPMKGDYECPGYVEGQTRSCHYVIDGTLQLELVRKVLPGKPKPPKPHTPPKAATVSPGAKKVSAEVLCTKRCKVKIDILPLKGGPRITAPRIVAPKPGRAVKVKISVPPSKRGLIKRAGGVRVKLTYRLAGGQKYSETRKART